MPPRKPIATCAHCGGSVLLHGTEDGKVMQCIACARTQGAKPVPLVVPTSEPVVGNAGVYEQKAG